MDIITFDVAVILVLEIVMVPAPVQTNVPFLPDGKASADDSVTLPVP